MERESWNDKYFECQPQFQALPVSQGYCLKNWGDKYFNRKSFGVGIFVIFPDNMSVCANIVILVLLCSLNKMKKKNDTRININYVKCNYQSKFILRIQFLVISKMLFRI